MVRISRNTIGMFDCLKGAMIFLVIVFHSFVDVWGINNSTDYSLIWKIINSLSGMAMGILFIISGYGFRPIKNKKGLKNQVRLLLKPYILVFIIGIFCRIPLNILNGLSPFYGAKEKLAGCLLGKLGDGNILGIDVESIFVFWYVISLFLGWILITLIFKLFNKELWRGITVLVCTLLGCLIGARYNNLPYCIVPTLTCISFLYFGYLIKKRNWLFIKISNWKYIFLAIISVFTLVIGGVNLSIGFFQYGVLDYIGTVAGCFLLLRIYLLLYNSEWTIYRPLMFLGRNSYMIICLHGFEHLVFQWKNCKYLLTDNVHLTAIIFSILRVLLILVLFYIIKYISRFSKKIRKSGVL